MQWKRYFVLIAAVVTLVCLGGSHGWNVFYPELYKRYGFDDFQTGLMQSTSVWTFCLAMIFAGRLHDRYGPRLVTIIAGILLGGGYGMAHFLGSSYPIFWFALGVLCGAGSAFGYVCPIATVVKWFPNHKGPICGVAAAGFGLGPIVLSTVGRKLMEASWGPLDIFGVFAVGYGLLVLLSGAMLATPPVAAHEAHTAFRRRDLFTDRRYWVLTLAMFCVPFSYLIVMARSTALAQDFGMVKLSWLAIWVQAGGNACGRLAWGFVLDRIGQRRSMLIAQTIMVAAVTCLIAGAHVPLVFFAMVFVIGSCYGSCFAIMPATVARQFGVQVLGSVYPFIMLSQAFSSLGQPINGYLVGKFGSPYPGLVLGLCISICGLAVTWFLLPRAVPGNADLPIGISKRANREISVPEDAATRR